MTPAPPHGPAPTIPQPSAPPRQAPLARRLRAPAWLQVILIVLLLASSVYAFTQGHILLGVLMAISGLAWTGSMILHRMVGDQYGRA